MRINQIRSFHIELDHEEALRYHRLGANKDQVFCDRIDVWVDGHGSANVRFRGMYLDPLDHDERDRPKKKEFNQHCKVRDLELPEDDPIMQFLGKLNLMRQDEMTLAHFMSQEDPVG